MSLRVALAGSFRNRAHDPRLQAIEIARFWVLVGGDAWESRGVVRGGGPGANTV